MIHADQETCQALWDAGMNMSCGNPSFESAIRDLLRTPEGVISVFICMSLVALATMPIWCEWFKCTEKERE